MAIASNALILPMAVHVGFTALLYALLTVARAPSIWGVGRAADGSNPMAGVERRISANLSNQFEWPLFFHVACVLMLLQPQVGALELAMAWLFIGGRVLHTSVQVFTTNVRLRGIVFIINFSAVIVMWGLLCARLSFG